MNPVRMIAGVLAFAATLASAAPRDEFAYAAPLELAGAGPAHQLSLPLHVYRNTVTPGRADLRVVNADGEVVPYALLGGAVPGPPAEPRRRTLPFYPLHGDAAQGVAALRFSLRGADGTLEVASGGASPTRPLIGYLVDARQIDTPVGAWSFQWEDPVADFDVTVRLHSSDDLLDWQPAAVGVLADLRQGERRFVRRELEVGARRARFWRLSWDAPTAPLVLREARAALQASTASPSRAVLSLSVAAVTGHAGEFTAELPGRLPIDHLNVPLPAVNTVAVATFESRPAADAAWQPVARVDLYRVAPAKSGAAEIRNGDAHIAVNTDPLWRIRIEPADAVPAAAGLMLELSWQPQALVFLARGRAPFTLLYGNAQAQPAAVPAETLLAGVRPPGGGAPAVSAASLGTPVVAGGLERLEPLPPPLPWKRWILWGVLIVGALLLLAMAWRLARTGE